MYTGVRVIEVRPEIINTIYKEKVLPTSFNKNYKFFQNEYIVLKDNTGGSQSVITVVRGEYLQRLYTDNNYSVSGVKPRNKEQWMTFNALMNPEIKVVVLTGKAGTGKAQPMDSKVFTPSGWKYMGDLQIGDQVLCPSGRVSTIQSIHPQGMKHIYRVWFSDGSSTECCREHLWHTRTQRDRDTGKTGSVKSLEEINTTLRYGKAGKRNHSIPMVQNIHFDNREQLIDPYLMGVVLGDGAISVGAVSISSADTQLIDEVGKILEQYDMCVQYASGYDYRLIHNSKPTWSEGNYIKNSLKTYGLWGLKSHQKFIPDSYKFASAARRLALLQGLLDTDGTVDKRTGNIYFYSTSKHLATDVQFLAQSFGGKAKLHNKQTFYTYNGEKKKGKQSYVVSISLPNRITPFKLQRKLSLVKPKTKYHPTRYIDRVEFVGRKPAQCIYIDDPDHLYITDEFIVTHNTLLTLAAALSSMESGSFKRMILTRPMSWVGKHGLGALPGEVEDKFGPYLENYMCNIAHLVGDQQRKMDHAISAYQMDFVPLQLIRGASWANAWIIADECQVLDYEDFVALGTRVGENSKIVIMGDLNQRDEKIAKEKTGIHKFVNNKTVQQSPLVASIELLKCERSDVAALFADVFGV